MKLDDLTLIRFVEHDLDEAEILEVEQLLADNEEACKKLEMLRGTSTVLSSTFGELKNVKPPEALVKKVRAIENQPKVRIFAKTSWLQVAATLVVGIMVGGVGSQFLYAPEDELVFRNSSSLRQYFTPNVVAKVFDAGVDGQSIKLEISKGEFLKVKIWHSYVTSNAMDCRIAIAGRESKQPIYSLGITACKPRNKLWSEAQVDFEEL